MLGTTNDRIGCPGVVVVIDESKYFHRKYHRDYYREGQRVFVAVEYDNLEKMLFSFSTKKRYQYSHTNHRRSNFTVIDYLVRPMVSL